MVSLNSHLLSFVREGLAHAAVARVSFAGFPGSTVRRLTSSSNLGLGVERRQSRTLPLASDR